MKNNLAYWLTESVTNHEKWYELLESKVSEADSAEFNLLYDEDLKDEILKLNPDLIESGKRKNKIYPSGMFLRYRLSDQVKEFILSKPYKTWLNYQLEDLSLLMGSTEILATITHENYVIVLMDDKEKDEWNNKDYGFETKFRK